MSDAEKLWQRKKQMNQGFLSFVYILSDQSILEQVHQNQEQKQSKTEDPIKREKKGR